MFDSQPKSAMDPVLAGENFTQITVVAFFGENLEKLVTLSGSNCSVFHERRINVAIFGLINL